MDRVCLLYVPCYASVLATCVAERLEQELNSANTKLQNTYKLHFA
jgi:hypothetical protein